jgi:hypothetical protein
LWWPWGKRNFEDIFNRTKRYIQITKMSDTSITVIYHAMSLATVGSIYGMSSIKISQNWPNDISVSLRRVIRLSQWIITLWLWLYCINFRSVWLSGATGNSGFWLVDF